MKGISKILIGIAAILVCVFTLFYVFDNIQKLADQCQKDPTFNPICGQMNAFTLSMLMVLLVIGGFVLVISATVYILLIS